MSVHIIYNIIVYDSFLLELITSFLVVHVNSNIFKNAFKIVYTFTYKEATRDKRIVYSCAKHKKR